MLKVRGNHEGFFCFLWPVFLSSICCQAQAETQWPSPQFSYERNGIYPTRSSKVVLFSVVFIFQWYLFANGNYSIMTHHWPPTNFGDLWIKSGWLEFWMYYGIPINQDIKIRPQTWPLSLGITHIYPPGLDPAKAPARAGAAQAAGAHKKTRSSQLGMGILGCFGKLLLMVQKSGDHQLRER